MKRFLKWMSGTMVVMLLLALPVSKVQAQDDYVSYQTFYDDLSPYGQWVDDPQYGNVWVPDAGNDFRPYYTNGYWAMTDYGNTWISNYPWGWAPFHYGRWTYNPFYGWVWIPGNTWGPAWVSWRWGGGQCGWAPMGPGVSISMSFGNYNCPSDWWVFVGPQYMYQRNFHSYWRGPRYNNTYINNTTIINNTYNNTYVYGPRANQIEQVTHQRVNTHRIGNRGTRGPATVNNNTVNIYRPSIRGSANEGRPRGVVKAPREVGGMQGGVRNNRTEFKQMVSRGEVKPANASDNRGNRTNEPLRQQPGREQRFDSRQDREQVRPATNDRGRMEQMQQDRNRNRIDRQQMEQRQNIDRQQMQERQRVNQAQDRQRMERQQMEQRQLQQRTERPQQQRIERPQMQQDRNRMQQMEQRQNMDRQRMEQRQNMQRQQMQERQRIERPQQQRMEQRPQMQRQEQRQMQQQRMEQRPQMQRMEQRQSAPRPQPQMQRQEQRQSSPQSRPSGSDRGGRR